MTADFIAGSSGILVHGEFLLQRFRECLTAVCLMKTAEGSFDSASASLGEAEAALRMTLH